MTSRDVMRLRTTLTLAAAALAAAACASASKRFEQGGQAAARGDWYAAASRYIDALEKDPSMQEAREGLMEAGDSAILGSLADVEALRNRGDPVAAAGAFHQMDALLDRARAVRVTLPVPEDWASRRRATFDEAVDRLMGDAADDRAAGRFGDARAAYQRIRNQLEPSAAQERASLDAEGALLVAWGSSEAEAQRFRAAYARAGEALALPPPLPAEVADGAADLQASALENGLRVLAVFPVGSTASVREAESSDMAGQLADLLELDHWREPPLFVAVADPTAVRQVTRRLLPPGSPFRPGRVLDEVGADFGALIELTSLAVAERDVKRVPHTTRTRQGRQATWTSEEGRVRYDVEATVTLFDDRGVKIASERVTAGESGSFERGVYNGDPGQLELSRGERLLFDEDAQRQRRADLEGRVLDRLAPQVADRTFALVVRRIS